MVTSIRFFTMYAISRHDIVGLSLAALGFAACLSKKDERSIFREKMFGRKKRHDMYENALKALLVIVAILLAILIVLTYM